MTAAHWFLTCNGRWLRIGEQVVAIAPKCGGGDSWSVEAVVTYSLHPVTLMTGLSELDAAAAAEVIVRLEATDADTVLAHLAEALD